MKQKKIPTKVLLCLVLLAICQFSVVVVPVHGLAWEVTTWITDGGSYGRGSDLDPGDRWQVIWNVTAPITGTIDVYFENATGGVVHTELESIGGSYVVTATSNGTHWARFKNPLDGGPQIQVYIYTNNLGAGIPAFNLIVIISLLGLLILFSYRRTKTIKI